MPLDFQISNRISPPLSGITFVPFPPSNPFSNAALPKQRKRPEDVKVLSSVLGHAQASTTLNLYAHALPDHKRTSMDKMRGFYSTDFDTNEIDED